MEFRRDSWMCLTCGRLRRGLKDKATLIRFVPVEHSIHFSYLLFDCTWWTEGGAVLLRCIFSGRTPVAHLALIWQNTRTLTLLTRIFRHNFNQVIQKLPRALRNSELPVTGSTQSYHFVFFLQIWFNSSIDNCPCFQYGSCVKVTRWRQQSIRLPSAGYVTPHKSPEVNRKQKKTYQSISTQLAKSWIHRIFLSNWKHNDRLAKFRAPKKNLNFFKWNH